MTAAKKRAAKKTAAEVNDAANAGHIVRGDGSDNDDNQDGHRFRGDGRDNEGDDDGDEK